MVFARRERSNPEAAAAELAVLVVRAHHAMPWPADGAAGLALVIHDYDKRRQRYERMVVAALVEALDACPDAAFRRDVREQLARWNANEATG